MIPEGIEFRPCDRIPWADDVTVVALGKKAAEALLGRKVNMNSDLGSRFAREGGGFVIVHMHPYKVVKAAGEKGGEAERVKGAWIRTWEYVAMVLTEGVQEPPDVLTPGDVDDAMRLLARVKNAKGLVGYDYETWGDVNALRPELNREFRILSVGFAFEDEELGELAFATPVNHPLAKWPRVMDSLPKVLAKLDGRLVAHNAKYEHKCNLRVYGRTWGAMDSMLASSEEDETNRHGLGHVMKREGLLWDHKGQGIGERPLDHPVPVLLKYNGLDALAGLICRRKIVARMSPQQVSNLEMAESFTEPLARLEGTGIAVDWGDVVNVRALLLKEIEELGKKAFGHESVVRTAVHFGREFKTNSPPMMRHLVLKELKAKVRARTAKGGVRLDKESIERIQDDYPVLKDLTEHRSKLSMVTGFLDKWTQFSSPEGRLHGQFTQGKVATERLSSTDPNFQNIPVRSVVKRVLISRYRGGWLIAGDYVQQEPRLVAGMSGDRKMLQALAEGLDIHAYVAAQIFNVPYRSIEKESKERDVGKRMNLGSIYGQTEYGLAKKTGISVPEARDFLQRYNSEFDGIADWKSDMVRHALRHGYVCDLFGGRRHLPEVHSRDERARDHAFRQAGNSPIQRTAARMTMLSLACAQRAAIDEEVGEIFLQVHDSLWGDTDDPEAMLDLMRRSMLVHNEMDYWRTKGVPFKVDFKVGRNMKEMEAISDG